MRDVFRGWDRKVGFVVLLVACVLTIAWIRSLTTTDYLAFQFKEPTAGVKFTAFRSHAGEIGWQDLSMFEGYCPVGWSSSPRDLQKLSDEQFMLAFVTVPYWWVVLPLTLISAWLLLFKTQRTNFEKPAQPTAIPVQSK
jgi:hypothetical protein